MRSRSFLTAVKVAAVCGLMAGVVVAAILTTPSGDSPPSQAGGSGSTVQNYAQREPPSLQSFFSTPTPTIGSTAPSSNSGGSEEESDGVLVASAIGDDLGTSGSSQQPPPSDWNNQVYNSTKPETIDMRLSSSGVCHSSAAILEARVTNGWRAGYNVRFVVTDQQQKPVYDWSGYNFSGRSVKFVLKPGELPLGKYSATASTAGKEPGRLPMSVTKPLEVIACEPGSSGESLRSETFSINASSGEVVIEALDGRNKLRLADIYITTEKGSVERSEALIGRLVLPVEGGPYSISAVIHDSGVKELLAANFKGL